MTKKEKILKAKEKINSWLDGDYYKLAEEIINLLEEPEPQKFREHEIVWYIEAYSGDLRSYTYDSLSIDEKESAEKLSIKELAQTTAPPDAVRWALSDNKITFHDISGIICENEKGYFYRTYCPHDGEEEGTL